MAVAVITGASTGIGRDLSYLCAEAGYDLVIIARNESQLEELAAAIRSRTGRSVSVLPKDLARVTATAEILQAIEPVLRDVEILINNAAVGLFGFFAELDAEQQMQMLRLNVDALTHLTRLLLPSMIARGRGRILNVASTAAFQPGPLMAVYYASKAYVLSLSEALHNELRGRGVSVTALCPGPTATEFQRRAGMGRSLMFRTGNVMDSGAVARAGFSAMMRGKPLVIPGLLNRLVAFSTRLAPRQVTAAIARRLQEE
jgi:short-subunit dehydrogenase